jgi:hypothetical protein
MRHVRYALHTKKAVADALPGAEELLGDGLPEWFVSELEPGLASVMK